jgi:hypothetical protein
LRVAAFMFVAPVLSVTLNVSCAAGPLTCVVGVPEIKPVEALRVSPPGRVPALTENVYGATPPVAVRVALNDVPTVAPPRGGTVRLSGGGAATFSAAVFVFVARVLSVTSNVICAAGPLTCVVGVPEIKPVEALRVSPPGRVPALTEKV